MPAPSGTWTPRAVAGWAPCRDNSCSSSTVVPRGRSQRGDKHQPFIFATSDGAIEEELAASGCDGVIAGHCGLPFTCQSGGRLWHNAGVIGMPANGGTRPVWYSVLTPSDDGVLIEHHSLDYGLVLQLRRDCVACWLICEAGH